MNEERDVGRFYWFSRNPSNLPYQPGHIWGNVNLV